jgi:hypothetical protein
VPQTVGADPSKQAGQPVLFRPARGASVVLASLSSNASNVQYRDLTMPNGWYVEAGGDPSQPGPTNVTFTDDHGGLFYIIGNVSNISVLGGDYGPAVDAHPMIAPANIGDLAGPVNIRVEGVNFHDFTRSGDLVHTECLQVYGGHGLVIERSRFSNCDGTGDLGIGSIGAFGLVNALVENNWFDSKGDSYFAVQTSMAAKGLVFRNNSGTRGIAVNTCDGCVGPLSLIGNYLPFAGCTAGATYSHNVFDGGKCSPTDVNVGSLDFVDPVGFDLRLKPGANAICRADPNSSPRLDYSGKARPKTRVADAGASELAMSVVPRKLAARCRTAAVAAKTQSAKAKARAKK